MKLENRILIGILIFATVLRFWNLPGPDIVADDATYSYRSVGYVDFMAATNLQSTPPSWFEREHWWQKLSFHDAPPLVFIAQNISFKIFGVNQFGARVPFALMGLLAVYSLYLLGRQVKSERLGLIAAGLIAISNYPVWLSRIGFLDGFLIPIIALSIYFFLRAKDAHRNYVWWAVMCGLGMLTKYTFLFILPLFFFWLLLYRRESLRTRQFWLGICLFLVLISPIVTYNVKMYQTRGHFDAAISTMLGHKPADFAGLTREKEFEPSRVGQELITGKAFSYPLLILALIGLTSSPPGWLVVGLLLALLELITIGAVGWIGAILVPFIIILTSLGAEKVWLKFNLTKYKKLILAGAGLLILFELSVTIQNQLAPRKATSESLVGKILETDYSASWQGYSELETWVANFYKTNNAISNTVTYTDVKQLADKQKESFLREISANPYSKIGQEHLLVFDERMDWFASFWIIERRRFYKRTPIHMISEFIDKTKDGSFSFYKDLGFVDATFIIARDQTDNNKQIKERENILIFTELLKKTVAPIDQIKNAKGNTVFDIYYFPFDPAKNN
ncbi:MAG: glycosyltransferase family 39 protein [Patescibacteria group bacterium]